MTPTDMAQLLAEYAAGLEAEISLLHNVQRLSDGQRDACAARDIGQLNDVVDERERVMTALVRLEHELRPVRRAIADSRDEACKQPQYASVVALHRKAADLVSSILTADAETVEALREAEAARRTTSRALEAGESTLAAYRRILSPTLGTPALVERRG